MRKQRISRSVKGADRRSKRRASIAADPTPWERIDGHLTRDPLGDEVAMLQAKVQEELLRWDEGACTRVSVVAFGKRHRWYFPFLLFRRGTFIVVLDHSVFATCSHHVNLKPILDLKLFLSVKPGSIGGTRQQHEVSFVACSLEGSNET